MKQSLNTLLLKLTMLCAMFFTGSVQALDFQPEIESVNAAACDLNQRNLLETISKLMERKLAALTDPAQGIQRYSLEYVQKNVIAQLGLVPSPRFKRHENTYDNFHLRVQNTLIKMRNKAVRGINYTCSSSWSGHCSGDNYAYVLDNNSQIYDQIYVCPKFFDQSAKAQAKTLFHELSHLVDINVEHYLGSVFNDIGMTNSAYDAYFYEKFMDDELAWVLERNAWRIIWVKP